MEKQGIVSKIIYKNDNSTYIVFAVETDDGDDETMTGYITGIEEGMYIKVSGEYKENRQYGLQFVVSEYEACMPDDIYSMERYLGSGAIKGVGAIMAKRIIKKFGTDTFRIIEMEPERLAEIKGISERKANEIGVQFIEKQEMREALMFLSKYGISSALAVKIYTEYGGRLYAIVKENPYKIAEDISGVGFKTADAIAMRGGIGIFSEFRIRAAVLYTLNQAAGLGHIYLPKNTLVNWTVQLLEKDGKQEQLNAEGLAVSLDNVETQLFNLGVDRKVVIKEIDGEEVVYSPYYYGQEKNTARKLIELKLTKNVEDHDIEKAISKIEEYTHIHLDEMQKEAVTQAAKNGVTVITGGPGTGKTTTINAIIRYFVDEGYDPLLAAPTGRAAKRMTEATGYAAQTIHRLLEINGAGIDDDSGRVAGFERNADNPLEADVIIIDEMSMVDQPLMHALVEAIPYGAHLILVGDQDQLPSVGAGNVLKDIIKSKMLPVVSLKRIFRQETGSSIVENAHKINNGEPIVLDNKSKDFFYVPRDGAYETLAETGALLLRKLPPYVGCTSSEIQVLTPMRNGPLGVNALNAELQKVLNPPAKDKKEKELESGIIFREGDKVMQIRNNYKLEWCIYSEKGRFRTEEGLGIFNGDMGVIREIDEYNEEIVVIFDDDKEVRYPYNMLDELELSYAITIHKSQGSEYPAVVLPLLNGPKILMNRNLLYTAVTRAKNCVVIVGNGYMVETMIRNNDEQKRYSSLDLRLQEFAKQI